MAQDTNSSRYSTAWYENFQDQSRVSAQVVVPLVLELVSPKSVVDVGCGTGAWLSVFAEKGLDIFGVDGQWVDTSKIFIPADHFRAVDLAEPFSLGETADLAMSLEVAEHIPAARAAAFVQNLTDIAPVVLFSAAIPHQGGTGHVNEQWPAYWAVLFKERGYVPVDCIRPRVWEDERVRYWYAQNTLVFVKEGELSRYPKLAQEIANGCGTAHALVHPAKYLALLQSKQPLIQRVFRKAKRLLGR